MRVVRRESERAVDARLELFGDDVLEPVRFVVDVVDVHAERLREIQLEQPVVADHLERDALARLREMRPRYGSCVNSSSAASFFTIADADAGATPMSFASAPIVTRPFASCSL